MRLIDYDALGIGKCNPEVFNDENYGKGWNACIELIENAPTVDAAPVKHGRWLNMRNGNAECSECGRNIKGVYDDDNADRFCRSCGAKMDLEEQDAQTEQSGK